MRRWFRRRLLQWFEVNRRDFAWRHTTDPYQVLLAEMMVQRTGARQAERTWSRFIARYPDLASTAPAHDAELRSMLAPLGLQWRIDNIIRALAHLRALGGIPRGQAELREVPGVGAYAAGAVGVCAFGQDLPVVDSNIVRVYTRFFGLPYHDGLRRAAGFRALATATSPHSPRRKDFTWALLDLGALVCTPRPRCTVCPLATRCVAAGRSASTCRIPREASR